MVLAPMLPCTPGLLLAGLYVSGVCGESFVGYVWRLGCGFRRWEDEGMRGGGLYAFLGYSG